MKALVVHAHPEATSFVTAMRDVVVATLQKSSVEVLQSDLYNLNFNPVLSPEDFKAPKNPSRTTFALEQRHGYETRTLSDDIMIEIDKLMSVELVIFTFPMFWFSLPAILKGWIDRVFISGPFYGGLRIYGNGGLKGKKALAAFSLGGREYMFGPRAIHGELESGMLRHFLQGALGYVGFDVIQPFIAYHVPYISTEERSKILENLADYVSNIERHPLMQMPDLALYDQRFKPFDE
jgi:NAD(P)H dehydrogenase (quinone)